jgi:hypothetical protein
MKFKELYIIKIGLINSVSKLLFLILCFISFNSYSISYNDSTKVNDTVKYWKFRSLNTFTLGQTSYKYWAQGGENSLNFLANAKWSLKYKKNNTIWDNNIEGTYGIMQQGERKVIKTDDKFEFISNFALKASENWNYNALINLKSQFTKGYKYPNDSTIVSDFFSPAYLITSFGFEYKKKNYTFIFSVLTGKTTFVINPLLNKIGAFGVEKDKKVKSVVGSFIKLTTKNEIVKNVELNNRIELFSDYFNNPEYVDVNWELLLKMKINKFMSANLNAQMIYDYDTKTYIKDSAGNIISSEAKIQIKETFGIAFLISF